MPEPRKHHYLPQFYLRNFSKNEKQLVQYEKSKAAKSFPTSVGDAGAIRDFHRIDHDETDDAFALEKHLAQLEGTQASMLETLINEGIESPSIHRGELVFFISLMRMRVPPVKQFFEKSLREIVRSSGHMLSRNNQLPPMPPDLEEELSPDKWKIQIYNWKVLQHMFMLALDADILSILEKMNISILRSKDNEFVTGDQPVSEYHPDVKANSSEGCALIDSRIEFVVTYFTKCNFIFILG